jgi:hypothetical protein
MPLSILLHFYRNFVWITSSITLFECILFWGSGRNLFVISLLLTKLVSEVFIAALFMFFQSNRMYFYHNLGLTKLQLFASAFLLDMMLWTLAVVLTAFIS